MLEGMYSSIKPYWALRVYLPGQALQVLSGGGRSPEPGTFPQTNMEAHRGLYVEDSGPKSGPSPLP